MQAQNQPSLQKSRTSLDARRHPRFKLQTEIRVYSRTHGLVKGQTVDISESGLAAMLRLEVAVGEIVQLEFELPVGPISIRALVRYQTAFRYGFQFVEPDPGRVIAGFCSFLAMKEKSEPNR